MLENERYFENQHWNSIVWMTYIRNSCARKRSEMKIAREWIEDIAYIILIISRSFTGLRLTWSPRVVVKGVAKSFLKNRQYTNAII